MVEINIELIKRFGEPENALQTEVFGQISQALDYFELEFTEFDRIRHSDVFRAIPINWSRYQVLETMSEQFNGDHNSLIEYLENPGNIDDTLKILEEINAENPQSRIIYQMLPSHLRLKWGYNALEAKIESENTTYYIADVYKGVWGLPAEFGSISSPELREKRRVFALETDTVEKLHEYRRETPTDEQQAQLDLSQLMSSEMTANRKSINRVRFPSGFVGRSVYDSNIGTMTRPEYYINLAIELFPEKDILGDWIYRFGRAKGYSVEFIDFVRNYRERVSSETGLTMADRAENARALVAPLIKEGEGLLADLVTYGTEVKGLSRSDILHFYQRGHLAGRKIEIDWLQGGGLVILENFADAIAMVDQYTENDQERLITIEKAKTEGFVTINEFYAQNPGYVGLLEPGTIREMLAAELTQLAEDAERAGTEVVPHADIRKLGNLYMIKPELITSRHELPKDGEVLLTRLVKELDLDEPTTIKLGQAIINGGVIGGHFTKYRTVNVESAIDWLMFTHKLPNEYRVHGYLSRYEINQRIDQVAQTLSDEIRSDYLTHAGKFSKNNLTDFFKEESGFRAVFQGFINAKKLPVTLYNPSVIADGFVAYLSRREVQMTENDIDAIRKAIISGFPQDN